jgi:hypothetical protein
MDRQQLDQTALDFIAERRSYHRAEADNGADDTFPEEDRRNRAVIAPGCRVKDDDDVLYQNYPMRVIGPARGSGWFMIAMQNPWAGNWMDVPMEVGNDSDRAFVTDRAPADPNEEPLPIFLESEEEPEPA